MIKGILISLFAALTSVAAWGQQALTADDLELERRVSEAQSGLSINAVKPEKPKLTAQHLAAFWALNEKTNSVKCQDHRKVLFAEKYVMTFDERGAPCRVYDLSFPNVQALMTRKSLFQVPTRKLTSRDFLDALDQNWEAIQKRNQQYAQTFNPKAAAQNSFVAQLKFKSTPRFVVGSQIGNKGLPAQFTLADLRLGTQFKLNDQVKADFQKLLRQLEASHGPQSVNTQHTTDLYQRLLAQPELILQSVKFEWNQLDKVYDVILDGRFLPFMGPVEVINFREQYRAPVEKLTRQLLGDVLSYAAMFIPEPTISSVVEIAIDDIFDQIELMYSYQALRLEQTLETMNRSLLKENEAQAVTRAANILYGQKADFITSFIMSAVQGQEFDWYAIEKMGASSAYNSEKQRKIMMSKMHNKLVLEKNCQTELVSNYFAICTKNGKKEAVYSLISEQSLPFFSFGAPQVFNYEYPARVSMIRGGSWLLSVGLRIVGLPLSRNITWTLDGYLKTFMRAGLLDEAFLQGHLLRLKNLNQMTPETESMMKWIYIQNLNPFLPKSHKMELQMIESNKQLMGQLEGA